MAPRADVQRLEGLEGSAQDSGQSARTTWTLIGADGRPYASVVPGTLGGHRKGGLYGRLDCRAARRAIARGGYVAQRVFFLDEATAQAAGYRPCAVCMPAEYARWKAGRSADPGSVSAR